MVLVDTSIWSLALRRDDARLSTLEAEKKLSLHELVRTGQAQLIGPIRQEILSGIRHAEQFARIRMQLSAFVDETLMTGDFETAAQYCNLLAGKGLAGSNVDFLICAVAASRSWQIFTDDTDFNRYSAHLPIALF